MTKLNVGLSKKIGLPDYGSKGATCSVEIELDHAELADPNRFHANVQELFRSCRRAVEQELSRDHEPVTPSNGNGRQYQPAPARNGSRRANGRPATHAQLRAIHAIVDRQRIDLTGELRRQFGVDRPEDLGIGEASQFIDTIKPANENGGGR